MQIYIVIFDKKA